MSINQIKSTVAPAFSGKAGTTRYEENSFFFEPTFPNNIEGVVWTPEDFPNVKDAPIFVKVDGRTVPDSDFRRSFGPWLRGFFRVVFARKGIRAMAMSRRVMEHKPDVPLDQQIIREEDRIGATLYNELSQSDLDAFMNANRTLFENYVEGIMQSFEAKKFFGENEDDRGGNYRYNIKRIIIDSIKEALLLNEKALVE